MPDDLDPTQTGGQGDGGQGGDNSGGSGDEGGANKDPSKPGDGEGGAGDGDHKKPDVITPERLTSVLDARQRKSEAAFKKLQDEQAETKTTLGQIQTSLEKLANPDNKPPAGDGKESKESDEVVSLRRKVDELETRNKASDERATSEAEKRKEFQFETDVKAALGRAKCLDNEAAFLVIKPRLTQPDDGSASFATVKTQYGEEDLPLDDYIARHFSEEIAPYLFKGKMRQGGPAGGDNGGGGGGSYDFTKEQLLDDPDLYAKDPEAARRALEKGRVKGVHRPGQALSTHQGRG